MALLIIAFLFGQGSIVAAQSIGVPDSWLIGEKKALDRIYTLAHYQPPVHGGSESLYSSFEVLLERARERGPLEPLFVDDADAAAVARIAPLARPSRALANTTNQS